MKLGKHLEGTAEEIKSVVKDIDPHVLEYLVPDAHRPVALLWLLLPAGLFVALASIVAISPEVLRPFRAVLTMLAIVPAVWLTAVVHYKFKNGGMSAIVAVGTLIVLAFAAGVVTLGQLLERAKDLR
jgi:hypothetical protein